MISSGPTIDFDHHSRKFSENRDDILEDLQSRCPVAHTDAHGGYWVVTSHEDVKRILGDPAIFSSAKHEDGTGGVTIPSVGPRILPAECDPPHHAALRRPLDAMFNRKAVEKLSGQVRDIVSSIVTRVIDKREFDIVEDIARVLPTAVTVAYLGFPPGERDLFIRAVEAAMSLNTGEGDSSGFEAFVEAWGKIQALVEQRRATPTDDLTSYLANYPDPQWNDEELQWIIFTLLIGGSNQSAMITNSLIYFAENRALLNRMIDDPTVIPKVAEELVRFISPGVSVVRNVTTGVEIGGVNLEPGDRVLMSLPAANHDKSVFEQGRSFDLERSSPRHLAYGYGPHFCLGTTLARLEFRLLVEAIIARMPDYVVHLERAERCGDASIHYDWKTVPASVHPV